MRIPLATSLAAIAAIGFAPFLSAAEPALARLVPADAAIVLALNDVPTLRKEFPESNIGRALADPQIARFFAPLTGNAKYAEFLAKVKEETGYTPAELLQFATGDVLFTLPASSLRITGDEPDVNGLIAIDVGDNEAKLRELIAEQRKKGKNTEQSSEDYNGATLYTMTPAEPAASGDDTGAAPTKPGKTACWTLHQGRLFMGIDRALVTGALDALAAGGRSDSLAASADYQQIVDRAGGRADGLLFFNWKAVYPLAMSALESRRDPNTAPNPFGVEPANIMRALGLDAIETVSFTFGTVGETSRVDGALTVGEMRGLAALAAYRDGPVLKPDWVPASWFNVSSQNFSLRDAYAELERIVDRVSPLIAGMAQGQIKTFERQLNLDLKRDIIGSIGESFVSGYALPAGANPETPPPYDQLDQFIGISLADAATFERAFETIKTKFLPPGDASPLKKRDYLDRTLYTVENPTGRNVTYAISDGWLLLGVGSSATVESVVQLMNAPNPAASFWQRADVREALASAPGGAFSVQHTELAPLLASVAASLVAYQEKQDTDDASLRFVDPSAQPTREQLARFFKHSIGYGTRSSGGFFFHSEGPAR